MISKYWNQFPLNVPIDGQLIWCRVDRWSGAPFAGRYSSADGTITSLINGITYPQWAISAWRNADPPIDLPPYPITGINGPDGNSRIQSFATTSPTWRLTFTMSAPPQNGLDYEVMFSGVYADPGLGTPPLSAFSLEQRFNLQPFQVDIRYGIIGYNNSAQLRLLVGVFTNSDTRVLVPGNRMFVRYRILHKPTGYVWPYYIESVQVT
jgi:hypothetical protein